MKIYKIILFIILGLMSVGVSAQDENLCGTIKKKAAKPFNEALDKFFQARKIAEKLPEAANKQFNEALVLFKQANTIDEDFAPIYYYLAYINIFRKQNNLANAEKYFIKAIDLCPDGMHDSYFQLGKIYFGQEKFDMSVEYLTKFLSKPQYILDDAIAVEAKTMLEWAKTTSELLKKPVKFNPKLVQGISSKDDEYLIIISPDDEKAFYTRRLPVKNTQSWVSENEYKERFFTSSRIAQGGTNLSEQIFDNGLPMPEPFNMNENEGGATITIDNKELIFTICKYEDKKNPRYANCDLYSTKFAYGYWSDIVRLESVNTSDYWESQPSISSDGTELYFISDRPGGLGGYDIYMSKREIGGEWQKPANMGKNINSSGNEKSPFMHTDSKTLYFSSDGRAGIGGYDIFYSRQNDEGVWQKPKNIGYPINTKFDDVGFFVSTNGKYGYFGSNNMNDGLGGWDFYSFELYEEARPEKVLFVKGAIKNEHNEMPTEARVELKNILTKEIKQIPIDIETGEYVAAIRFESDFMLTVKQPDYVYESTYISKEDSTFDEPKKIDVDIEPVQIGKTYKINDIYYESNSDALLPESKKVLEEFADFLSENPNIKAKIQGHTDNIGSDVSNMILSENRAKSVFNYLISIGISAHRLSYKGYGESSPVATNDTESGRSINRRTEFLIIDM